MPARTIKTIPESFTWTAPEFILFEKGRGWFLAGAGIAVVFLIIGFFLKLWLFMGVVVSALFAIWSFTRNKPDMVRYNINRDGIKIGNKTYPFSKLTGFWIAINPPNKILYLQPKRKLSMPINIHLADQDPIIIRGFLLRYLSEIIGRGEDVTDRLVRWIKF